MKDRDARRTRLMKLAVEGDVAAAYALRKEAVRAQDGLVAKWLSGVAKAHKEVLQAEMLRWHELCPPSLISPDSFEQRTLPVAYRENSAEQLEYAYERLHVLLEMHGQMIDKIRKEGAGWSYDDIYEAFEREREIERLFRLVSTQKSVAKTMSKEE